MNTLPSSKAASRAVKNFVSFPEITDFLDRAQQTMLGFGPDWGDRLLSSVATSDVAYPPYDLLKIDDQHYRIVIAIAGFSRDELHVEVLPEKQSITVSASPTGDKSAADGRRIAKRSFTKTYVDYSSELNLAYAQAKYENGLLTIVVPKRTPAQPLAIEIG